MEKESVSEGGGPHHITGLDWMEKDSVCEGGGPHQINGLGWMGKRACEREGCSGEAFVVKCALPADQRVRRWWEKLCEGMGREYGNISTHQIDGLGWKG